MIWLEVILLVLVIGYCLYVLCSKKKKGCCGNCANCSGCSHRNQ